MFDRLNQMEALYEELGQQLSDPAILSDQKNFQAIAKQHRDLEPTVDKLRQYRGIERGIADARAMAGETDEEMRVMAEEELATLEPRLTEAEDALKLLLLLPKDPNDDKEHRDRAAGGYGR